MKPQLKHYKSRNKLKVKIYILQLLCYCSQVQAMAVSKLPWQLALWIHLDQGHSITQGRSVFPDAYERAS
jgi:hypothetical protein